MATRTKKSGNTYFSWLAEFNFPSLTLDLIGFGWVLAFFSLLALLNFHPIVKTELEVLAPLWVIWPVFILGIALAVVGYRSLPPREMPDVGRRTAWSCLAVIIGLGAFLRLYHAGHPPGPFWDDWATNFLWVHQILDKNKFFWMMPSDGIEPFVPYVTVGIMGLLPDEVRDLIIRRAASTLIDVTALWVLYLCGKELGSRRIGLIAAALGALGRPMIQLTITGMRAFSLSLAVGLLILASLKLFRKPSLKHFLWWGAALAFGAHTYSAFRVFMLAVPFLILPWVWRIQRKEPFHPAAWAGALGSVFLLLGVYSGTFAVTHPLFTPWSFLWDAWTEEPLKISGVFILCLAPTILAAWMTFRKGAVYPLAGWSLGLGLSCLLIFPMTLSEEFNGRMAALSAFRNPEGSQDVDGLFLGKIWQTIKSLFYACLDRNDLLIGTDPFYDLFSQGALLLGLVFLLTRPDWKKAYLLVLAALGTLVYILSIDPGSTKLIASAPPLYLLAAWGISRIFSGFSKPPRKGGLSLGAVGFSVFLASYGVWGCVIQFQKIYGYWAKIAMVDTVLADCVEADEKKFRVYLAPSDYFFGWNSQTVLNEGRRYYILKDINSIPVGKGEPREDIVVFVYGTNYPMQKELQKRFPKSLWGKIYVFPHTLTDPNPELYMYRVVISGADITSDPHAVLHVEEQEGKWVRRYYNHSFGWALSGILRESRVEDFSDPINSEWLTSDMFKKFKYAQLLQMTGSIEAAADGEYVWTFQSADPLWFRIDGDTIIKQDTLGSQKPMTVRKYLKKGNHLVEMRSRFPNFYQMPEIKWRLEGESENHPL